MSNSSFGIHKSWILLSLVLTSMVMLFLASSIAMLYLQINKDLKSIQLPYLFYFNTLLLMLSSLIFHRISPTNQTIPFILNRLGYILLLTLIFLLLQSVAWYWLIAKLIYASSDRLAGFIYFYSGLHFIHVLAGVPFLSLYYLKLKKLKLKDQFLNPEMQQTLRLLRVYWHFLDFLWIYLILFLSVMIYFF